MSRPAVRRPEVDHDPIVERVDPDQYPPATEHVASRTATLTPGATTSAREHDTQIY